MLHDPTSSPRRPEDSIESSSPRRLCQVTSHEYIPLWNIPRPRSCSFFYWNISVYVLHFYKTLHLYQTSVGSLEGTRNDLKSWKVLLYMYAILAMPVLLVLLIGVNINVWVRERINYPFIFGKLRCSSRFRLLISRRVGFEKKDRSAQIF